MGINLESMSLMQVEGGQHHLKKVYKQAGAELCQAQLS